MGIAAQLEAAEAALGVERPLRTRHRPQRRRRARRTGHGALRRGGRREGRGRGRRRVPATGRARAHPRPHEQGQRRARHRPAATRRSSTRSGRWASKWTGSGDDITAIAPTFRPDLEREIDIVEEVARRVGFESIGRTVARPREQVGVLTPRQRERRVVADALVGAGLSEAVTIPLVAPADLERAGAPLDRLVEAANPLRAEESVLRTRILPGLLRSVAHNHAHGLTDVGLFEVGHVFLAPAGRERCCRRSRPISPPVLAGTVRRRPVEDDRPVDPFDALDVLHEVFDALEIAAGGTEAAERPGFDPARGRRRRRRRPGDRSRGGAGPRVARGARAHAAGRRVRAGPRSPARRPSPGSHVPAAFPVPAVDHRPRVRRRRGRRGRRRGRDAARAPPATSWRTSGCSTCSGRTHSAPGRKSLAFALRFRAPDRTLTDDEVGEIRRRCVEAAAREHSGELRG